MIVWSCIAVTKTLYHWCFFREWYRSRSLYQELKLNRPDCLCWRRHTPSTAMETRLQENRWVCQQYWEHTETRAFGNVHRLTIVLLLSTPQPYLVLHTSCIAVDFTHSCFSKDLIFLCYWSFYVWFKFQNNWLLQQRSLIGSSSFVSEKS